jgi:hypothetical protein
MVNGVCYYYFSRAPSQPQEKKMLSDWRLATGTGDGNGSSGGPGRRKKARSLVKA